jgi:hypothetical protein
MDGTRNAESAVPGEDGEFDSKEAARILQEATSNAQRNFDLKRPLIWVIGGSVTFLAYGALWFSVRDQHPYKGPSLAVIAGVYAVIIVAIAVSAKMLQRATKGVSGPSRALMAGEGVAVVVAYIATAVIQGALHDAGASHAIVYGIFPAAAPLVIVGCTVAGSAGSRQDWQMLGGALAVVSVGIAGLFVSAAASWAVVGIGLFAIALVAAIAKAWLQHRKLALT